MKKRDVSDSDTGRCYPTADWSKVPGMDQWCTDNCRDGVNNAVCPEAHCQCPSETGVRLN